MVSVRICSTSRPPGPSVYSIQCIHCSVCPSQLRAGTQEVLPNFARALGDRQNYEIVVDVHWSGHTLRIS